MSERTARRDLEALGLAGLPIYSVQGRGGGWRLAGGGRTDLSGLSAAEARALFLVAGPSSTATPEVRGRTAQARAGAPRGLPGPGRGGVVRAGGRPAPVGPGRRCAARPGAPRRAAGGGDRRRAGGPRLRGARRRVDRAHRPPARARVQGAGLVPRGGDRTRASARSGSTASVGRAHRRARRPPRRLRPGHRVGGDHRQRWTSCASRPRAGAGRTRTWSASCG